VNGKDVFDRHRPRQPFGLRACDLERLVDESRKRQDLVFAVQVPRRADAIWRRRGGTISATVGIAHQQRDEVWVQGLLDSRHNRRGHGFQTRRLSNIFCHLPQQTLSVVVIAKESAVQRLQPLMLLGSRHESHAEESHVHPRAIPQQLADGFIAVRHEIHAHHHDERRQERE
jgi:hypothetical protein